MVKIRMLVDVYPELFFMATPGTILRAGKEYEAAVNRNSDIAGCCESGELLEVKLGEFEFIDAPEWVLNKCGKCGEKQY